mmetsp:Transcript_22212/g.61855  ORF Transcript_22212/g.61855 Transcript_22212/m.61855 type:complete len:224 (-) Transcript_22212:1869-2540(-)
MTSVISSNTMSGLRVMACSAALIISMGSACVATRWRFFTTCSKRLTMTWTFQSMRRWTFWLEVASNIASESADMLERATLSISLPVSDCVPLLRAPLGNRLRFLGLAQNVCISPLPLMETSSCRVVTQLDLPAALSMSAVSLEMWIRPSVPALSNRAATFMVSPKSWNLALAPRRTPAVTGPLCIPHRALRSPVDGPSSTSSRFTKDLISLRHSYAKRTITTA